MPSPIETDALGQMVRDALEKRGLTQRDAAKAIGIHAGDFSRMISGREKNKRFGPSYWNKVATYLGLDTKKCMELLEDRRKKQDRGFPVTAKLLSEETRIPADTFRKIADLAETMPEGSMDFRSLVVVLSAYERDS